MQDFVIMTTTVPAVLRTFAACPRCGVREKPARTIHIPATASPRPKRKRMAFSCERCGSEQAVLVLERCPVLH